MNSVSILYHTLTSTRFLGYLTMIRKHLPMSLFLPHFFNCVANKKGRTGACVVDMFERISILREENSLDTGNVWK